MKLIKTLEIELLNEGEGEDITLVLPDKQRITIQWRTYSPSIDICFGDPVIRLRQENPNP
jgi:hypothetical protein